jgi:hypothetical protein
MSFGTKVTVTSDIDRTSSISIFGSAGIQTFFANIDQQAELHLENVTVYDQPFDVDGQPKASIKMKGSGIVKLRNSVLVTSDKFVSQLGSSSPVFANIYDAGGTSMIEIQDSELTMFRIYSDPNEPSTHIQVDGQTNGGQAPQMVRLVGSSFVHIRTVFSSTTQLTTAVTFNDITADGCSMNMIVDNCYFYGSRINIYQAIGGYVPTSMPATLFYANFAGAGAAQYIYYVGRSVHNYDNGFQDPYAPSLVAWTELSGYSTSQALLGVYGFGLNEFYDLVPRHSF